jgi:hypothetical protein
MEKSREMPEATKVTRGIRPALMLNQLSILLPSRPVFPHSHARRKQPNNNGYAHLQFVALRR